MRVNVDSSVFTDSRFRLLAKHLGINQYEALGRCVALWMTCYDRRSKCLTTAEADASADMDGFANALILVGLATRDECAQDVIEVHGVDARIDFLRAQSARGRRGGKQSAKGRKTSLSQNPSYNHEVPVQANAQAFASGAAQAEPEANAQASASGAAQAYSPDLALALDLDLAQDQSPDLDREKSRKNKFLLPPTWEPTAEHHALASSLQLACTEAATAMRDWAKAENARKADWDATFRNWLRREARGSPRVRNHATRKTASEIAWEQAIHFEFTEEKVL